MVTPRCPENAMARPLVRDEEGVSTLVSLIGVLLLVIAILAVGDATPIAVPPDLGYGAADPTKVFVKPLFESVPVHLTMDASDFSATYKAPAVSGANTTDPFWGWPATVSVSGSVVTVTNSPTPGQTVPPYGARDARVHSLDDGADGGA